MSAFICSKNHVAALANYAVSKKIWLDGRSAGPGDFKEIYQILAYENARSVWHRYAGGKADGYSDFVTGRGVTPHVVTEPVQILKLVECLEYQSCETDDWKETRACQILGRIKTTAINSLPGYDDAKWAIA